MPATFKDRTGDSATLVRRAGRGAVLVRVNGVAQGVGFRPFVHRLALQHGLVGWVRNSSGCVEVHAEGERAQIARFLVRLREEAPPLARLESLEVSEAAEEDAADFAIVPSETQAGAILPPPPDLALCQRCAAELADLADRRYGYPFITCTDCGPRFTVIAAMPYDRERTSMAAFEMCADCQREYLSPGNRRHHSQTNSCPACGPVLWYEEVGESEPAALGDAAVDRAAQLLLGGGVLALRGIGGFHLAVDATSAEAVQRLRQRKQREAKPLAVMVRDLAQARAIAQVGEGEARILQSPQRPIVLLRAREGGVGVAAGVAPGLDRVGLMLAYSPLHSLLLERVGRPLVMTSGNLSDEPIAAGLDEGRLRLRGVADGFLLHDREILARCDDSVVRLVDEVPLLLRRARGYVPLPLGLPVAAPRPLLAVGPHLKNTFTLVRNDRAFVSQHIGDLESLEGVAHWESLLVHFRSLLGIEPEVVVHDLHPGYLSTRLALESGLEVLEAVQHHHAHVAAVMAEHGLVGPVLGVAYDGVGLGSDDSVWGAELLLADLVDYRRVGRMRSVRLPGGDLAARSPWRAALGFLGEAPELAKSFELAFQGVEPRRLELARQQLEQRLNAPQASSMGRLFDAAAAVLGVCREARYEGEAAMLLESLAGGQTGEVLPFCLIERHGCVEFDPLPLLAALGELAGTAADIRYLAASFHDTVVRATVEMVRLVAAGSAVRCVALAGGCFQNGRLLAGVARGLREEGLQVLVPRELPPNDGAVSYGQAAVAAARLAGVESQLPDWDEECRLCV
jgi:hydrogenase maturation protein HypF